MAEQNATANQPAPQAQAGIAQMTQAQIDAIPDPALRAQVMALMAERNTLASKVKEKDPTWVELGEYGKGVAGIKISKNGALQITGTRKSYGGLYIFGTEMNLILENHSKIREYMVTHAKEITVKEAKTDKTQAAPTAPDTQAPAPAAPPDGGDQQAPAEGETEGGQQELTQ